jgi:hypothetical protein
MTRSGPRRLRADIVGGLRGAAYLLIGHERALDSIAADTAAIHHSFAAPLFCLPVSAFITWVIWRSQAPSTPLWHAAGVNLALYAINWAGFLLIAKALLRPLDQPSGWPRLVAVWNWSNVAQYLVLLTASLFELARVTGYVLNVVSLVSLFWSSWIEFRALRPVLGGSAKAAGVLVAVDIALGILTQVVTVNLGG